MTFINLFEACIPEPLGLPGFPVLIFTGSLADPGIGAAIAYFFGSWGGGT